MYGEFWELLLGFVVMLPPEGAPLPLGVGFGFGVVLPARSSGAIEDSKWQDQACVDSKTQIYARSIIVTVHNRIDKAMVEGRMKVTRGELYRGAAPCIIGMLAPLTEVVPKHATQVCTDFLQRKTVHAGADVKG